jgi:hypothetical protein
MSDKNKKVPVDTDHIREGDVVKIPLKREGDAFTYRGLNVFLVPKPDDNLSLTGLTVDESDIVRAPVPREVVSLQFEVLRDDDRREPGDIAEYADGSIRKITFTGDRDIACIPSRVLRPIKKS